MIIDASKNVVPETPPVAEPAVVATVTPAVPDVPATETVAPVTAPPAPPEPDYKAEYEKEHQRYLVVQGMQQAAERQRREAVEQRDKKLAELQARLAEAEARVQETGYTPEQLKEQFGLTDEESEIGQEVLSAQIKIAQRLRERDREVTQEPEPETFESEEDISKKAFFDVFEDPSIGFPNWREIEDTEVFQSWLSADPLRDAALQGAYHNRKPEVAIDVYQRFFADLEAAKREQDAAAAPKGGDEDDTDLQVQPRTAPVSTEPQRAVIIPKAEYDAFMTRYQQATITTEPMRVRFEEMTRALIEGRIR